MIGWWTLTLREMLRYLRRPANTFMPPIINNTLYFTVFGVILGSRIRTIDGVPYIQFILPGLIALGLIANAFENAMFSVFHSRWNRYINEVLTSPISHHQIVLAYIVASVFRAGLVALLIAGVGMVFAPVAVPNPLHLIGVWLVVGTLFAGLGLIAGLAATDWEHMAIFNQFVLRPLIYFGGVFYSVDNLPSPWVELSYANPLLYAVCGVRYGMLGVSDVDPLTSLAALALAAAVVVALCVFLVRRGLGLTT